VHQDLCCVGSGSILCLCLWFQVRVDVGFCITWYEKGNTSHLLDERDTDNS